MDNQLSSPNQPTPSERPAGFNIDNLQPVTPGVEVTPAPGTVVPPAAGSTATPDPKLTSDDVAAALTTISDTGAPVALPTPQIAGDIDVIEPEWVEKAEQVVQAHAGDPYAEEEAIEELQQEYLQKRYGIHVEDSDAKDTKPKGV
jgi:hypothetical protein